MPALCVNTLLSQYLCLTVIFQFLHLKTARLSGTETDDEDLEEIEELERMTTAAGQDLFTRVKKYIHDLVERVGFFGILVCASVSRNKIYLHLIML